MRRLPLLVASVPVVMGLHGCLLVPVPISRDPLHPREERPVAAEVPALAGNGSFSVPAFDASGERLAVFESATREIQIRRTGDLSLLASITPDRWPRRLAFSPSGRFLLVETHVGWVDALLQSTNSTTAGGNAPPDTVGDYRDDVQRTEVWELSSGRRVAEVACDAIETTEPQRGWLWARNKAIVPGYRSSALLAAWFPPDESTLEVLCWTGCAQRWDTTTWARLPDRPPSAGWTERMGHTPVKILTDDGSSASTPDGLSILVRALEPGLAFGTLYAWSHDGQPPQHWPGDCAVRQVPTQALSADGQMAAALCNAGLGYAVRIWDRGAGREVSLEDADFGVTKGAPIMRGQGVALSPDGRYVAAVVLSAARLMLVTPLPGLVGAVERSDLRLWRLSDGREVVSVPIDALVGPADYFRGIDITVSPASDLLALAGRGLRVYRLAELDSHAP